MRSLRIIGPGRAGCSLATALRGAGWDVVGLLGRGDDPSGAASGVDVLVIATPDDVVAEVAAAVRPEPATVVVHLSGSLGLDALAPHPRRAALHPLVPLPDPAGGARRLAGGVAFAVAGDPVAREMAESLGGRPMAVADADRATYHAAACIAANHVVALLGQVERVAAAAGLPLDAFLDLTRAAVDDVARLGPRRALTGPAARGDWATLARHGRALAPEERPGYNAGVALAVRLATGHDPVGPTPGSAGRGEASPATGDPGRTRGGTAAGIPAATVAVATRPGAPAPQAGGTRHPRHPAEAGGEAGGEGEAGADVPGDLVGGAVAAAAR